MTPIPELIAHRGYTLHYPENTLAAVEAAIRAGTHYVEVDIQLSADKVPMLFHDRGLRRLCGVNGMVHEFTREQLAKLHASDFDRFGYRYANEPIATLAGLIELLLLHPHVQAFIEIKEVSIERFGIDTVLEQVMGVLKPAIKQCILISFSHAFLHAARLQHYPRLGAVLEKWRDRKNDIVQEIKPDYIFCDAVDLPRWGRLQAGTAQLAVYEITDPHLAIRLARRGVPLIETFAIGEMLNQLELLRAARA